MEVDSADILPKLICSSCAEQINTSYQFKLQCEANEEVLQSIIVETISDSEKHIELKSDELNWDDISIKDELDENPISSEDKNKIKNRNVKTVNKKRKCKISRNNQRKEIKAKSNKNSKKQKTEKNNICDICGKHISRQDNLKRHRLDHFRNKDTYNCEICNTKFKFLCSLKKHKKNVHDNLPRKKEICNLCGRFYFHLYAHIKLKHNNSDEDLKFHCSEVNCGEKFPYKSLLEKHILKYHRGEILSRINKLCTQCGKVLHSEKGYKYHMLYHSGEKPFKCSYCSVKFRSHYTLRRHERRHTDERPYQCPHCEKAFRSKNVLLGHVRIHTGEKPYVCQICSKSFRQKITLTTHMKIH